MLEGSLESAQEDQAEAWQSAESFVPGLDKTKLPDQLLREVR